MLCHVKSILFHYSQGYEDIVDLLVEKGVNVNLRDEFELEYYPGFSVSYKRTPLMWAVAEGRKHMVEKLLESGASMTDLDEEKGERERDTILHLAIKTAKDDNTEILQTLCGKIRLRRNICD